MQTVEPFVIYICFLFNYKTIWFATVRNFLLTYLAELKKSQFPVISHLRRLDFNSGDQCPSTTVLQIRSMFSGSFCKTQVAVSE
jgi:hypothetical protein